MTCENIPIVYFKEMTIYSNHVCQWGSATGIAATVATATFYVVKNNKAEKIP
jgi:hypothetical protein